MCGESMRLSVREVPNDVQGESPVRVVREWVCPECDYFEESDADEQ